MSFTDNHAKINPCKDAPLNSSPGSASCEWAWDREGWTTVWANDLDEKKWEMYRANFNDGACEFVLGDVHAVNGQDIPDIDLATASFPCNDLSLAGSRHGLAGTQSSAFWGFVDALKGMGRRRPTLVLLENVAGFLTSNDGHDFRDALLALNELGYAVDAFIVDAARFVPQSRQRLFVVGSKTKLERLQEPSKMLLQAEVRPAVLADFIFMNPEIDWSLRNLPSLPFATNRLQDVIEDVPMNSELWWSKERCEYLLNQMSARHRAEADRMIAGVKWSYGTVFRRVRKGRSMGELRTAWHCRMPANPPRRQRTPDPFLRWQGTMQGSTSHATRMRAFDGS